DGADAPLLPREDHLVPRADPGDRRGPVRVQPRLRHPRVGHQRLLPGHRQRGPARAPSVVLPLAGPLRVPRRRRAPGWSRREADVAQSVDTAVRVVPRRHLHRDDAELAVAVRGAHRLDGLPGARDSVLQARRAVLREGPVNPRGRRIEAPVPDYAIDVNGLGVRYNLRLTRQTTVRTSFRDLLKKRDGPTHFWALRDVSF